VNNIDYSRIAFVAHTRSGLLLDEWLPGGRVCGREYVVLNPTRADKHQGSFSINLETGRWADFATGVKGGDFISLYAFIKNISQAQAAVSIARMLGIKQTVYGRLRGGW